MNAICTNIYLRIGHKSLRTSIPNLWYVSTLEKRSGALSIWECLQLTNAITYKTSELPYSLLKLKELISSLYSALKK